MNTRELVARWSLGRVAPEDFPGIASELLMTGHDGPALRDLAGLVRPTLRDAAELFDRAISECGLAQLPRESALGILAWSTAQRIVDGDIKPYSGACTLSGLASDSQSLPELFAFYEFTDAYCGYLEGRTDLDEAIRHEAARFLETHPELAA